MAVSQQTPLQAYTASGASAVFAFSFQLLNAADMTVLVEGVPQALGADFGVTTGLGGSVTLVVTPTAGQRVVLLRNSSVTRSTDYQNNGDLLAAVVNADFDRIWLVLQELVFGSKVSPSSVRAPAGEVLSELPTAAARALRIPAFDSAGNLVTIPGVDGGSASALALSLLDSTTEANGVGQIGRGYGLAYGPNTAGAALGHYINAAEKGAVADGVTNSTAAVQAALNALGAPGGTVQVDPGVRFNMQSLTFPQRANLEYWMDSDLSRPNPSTTLGTNERVIFMANANASGIVNELQLTASFHPGLVVDVRRDVAGHDAFLGAGQDRVPTASEPARASINFADQQVGVYRTIYQAYGGATYSLFAGTYSNGWRNTVTITGVGTGAGGFVSVPAVGALVTGSVSGAKGWFLSATTTTTTLLWDSGRFAVGDRLIDSNETTVNAASAVVFSIDDLQTFGQDSRKGNWTFGLPVGIGEELVNVGGRVALLPSRDFGQYKHKTITHPGLLLADLVTDVPTNGFAIHYDTTAAAASRRLTVRKLVGGVEQTTDAAHLNACRAHVNFNNSAAVGTSAFNVASVTRTGTGRYDVVFARAMERADYSVLISLEEASTKGGYPLSKTVNGFTLAVATLGGTVAVDLAAIASIAVFGGDI